MVRLLLALAFLTSGSEPIADLLAEAKDANCERRPKDAVAIYSRVLSKEPYHAEALLGRSLAHEQLEEGQAALADLDAVLSKQPNHPAALVARARVLRRHLRDIQGALKTCETLLRLEPNHVEGLYQRGAARIASSDPKVQAQGRDDLERYHPLDPLDLRYFVVLGDFHVAAKDWKAAKACYLEARKLGPDLQEGDFEIAMAALAGGEPDEAQSLLEGLRQSRKVRSRMKGRYGLVVQLAQQSRMDEARAVIEEGIADDEKAAAPLFLLRAKMHYDQNDHEAVVRDCSTCLKHAGREIGDAYFYRGVSHAFCERYPEAVADLTASIRANPDHFESYRNRCIIHMQLGRCKEAAADADQCAKLEPKNAVYVVLRGVLRKQLKEWELAERDFTAGLALDPEFKGVHFDRGQVRARMGKFREAIRDIEEALKQSPDDAEIFSLRAHCWLMLGDKAKALADYAEVKKLNRGDPTAHLMHAVLAEGRFDDALEALDSAIRDEPKLAFWRSQRASIYIKQKEWEKALADCEAGLELEPNDVALLGNRALCFLSLKNADKAVQDCDRAIALDATDTNVWSIRCMANFQRGKLQLALSDANEYIRRAPDSRQAYANRAIIHQALGETAKAAADAAKAAKLETTIVTNAKNATFSFAIGMADIVAVPPPPPLKATAPQPPSDLPPLPVPKAETESPVPPPPPLSAIPAVSPLQPALPVPPIVPDEKIPPPPPLR